MAIQHTNGPHGIRLPRGPFVLAGAPSYASKRDESSSMADRLPRAAVFE
jgi:hypothetical protein